MMRLPIAAALLLGVSLILPRPAAAQTAPKSPTKAGAKAPAGAHKPAAKKGAKAAKPAPVLPPVGGLSPQARATQLTEQMRSALSLDAKQVQQVQAINLRSVQQIEEAHNALIGQLPQMRTRVEAIGETRLSLLYDVLSPEQFRTYTALREKKLGIPQEAAKQAARMNEGEQ